MANFFSNAKAYVAFQVQVNPELKEKLASRAYENGVSQKSIVEEALRSYLKSDVSQSPQKNMQNN